ncbi:calcium-binding protein, partial [Aurantiacibacter flavus]
AMSMVANSGDNTFYGTSQADTLNGGTGNDTLVGRAGNDILSGGSGNDLLIGGGNNDTYLFNLGDGQDIIQDDSHGWGAGYGGTDTLQFGAGIDPGDVIVTQANNGNDYVLSISGTTDQVTLSEAINNNNAAIESVVFSDGTVWDQGAINSHLFEWFSDINGTNGNEVLNGTSGNEHIYAYDGNDTLTGSGGNDYLNGGSGDDTYIWNRGDGSDTLYDTSGIDTLRFGVGIVASDLSLSVPPGDADSQGLIIAVAGTSDRLYLRNQNTNNGRAIERFEFTDGTILTDAQLRAQLMSSIVTDNGDRIYGTGYADVIVGGAGNDDISSGNGNDTLTGSGGNDYLNGGSGDDTYIWNRGDGSDTLYDTSGIDTLRFGVGIVASDLSLSVPPGDADSQGLIIAVAGTSDRLYLRNQNTNNGRAIERFEFTDGTILTDAQLRAQLMSSIVTNNGDRIYGTGYADVIVGGAGNDDISSGNGNDTLTGSGGNDYLNGGSGDDTYIWNRGDGSDTLYDTSGIDTLRFGVGVAESDIQITSPLVDGANFGITLLIRGTHDRIDLPAEFGTGQIENIVFQSGSVWNVSTLQQLVRSNSVDGRTVAVTMGNDTIVGAGGDDSLRGMKGDDVLRGGRGSDVYNFAKGDGHDAIYDPTDAQSTDTLVLENINAADVQVFVSPTDAQDLILYIDDDNVIYLDQQAESGSSGIEVVQFADGTTWDRATLEAKAGGLGTAGDNTLTGTNFGDTLQGGLGDDTLIGGAGNDTYVYNVGDDDDTIVDDSGAGNDPSQAGNSGNINTLAFGAGITLSDLVLTQPVDGGPLVISFVSLAGSITLDGLDPGGRSGVDQIHFADGSSVTMAQLRASAIDATVTTGDDLIRGFGSDDVLGGGAGNDVLAGGAGADTYVFALGDGADIIAEMADGSTNILAFAAGIATADIRLLRPADAPEDLVLMLSNGTDEVTIKSQFTNNGAAGIQQIRFADGTIWQAADFETILLAQPATASADYLIGAANGNVIDGLAGDDVILGGAGDDVLYGSEGNDHLYGGAGNDELHGGAGDDILSGDTGTDLLDGGEGFDIADYSFSLDKWSIDLAAGTASIVTTQNSTLSETLSGIEGVIGGLGADIITGDGNNNRLEGGGGNDTLDGAGGNDTFVFDGDEDGVDAIHGGSGNDVIEAASDNTVIDLSALTSVELITALGHANVTIEATDGADTLDFSASVLHGIVSIDMGGGDDVVTGSLGADTINAGAGNDIIRYVGTSTGADQIDGGVGSDTITAGADDTVILLGSFQNVEAISGGGFSNVVLARTDDSETTDLSAIVVSGLTYIDLAGGNDSFVGTAGADIVRGGAGDDSLTGGAGDDVFQYASPDSGYDAINGGAGSDQLQAVADGAVIGIGSISSIEAIDGNGFANVTIDLGDGDDHLDLSNMVVTDVAAIVGGKGNDVLRGSTGDETFLVSGTDQGIDDFEGGAGQDRILAGADGTVIRVSRLVNVETIDSGGHAAVNLALTDGNDTLSLQSVTLTGIGEIDLGAGADNFTGSAVGDVIAGGAGNDTISGDAGDDVYLFGLGDGNDIIREKTASGVGGGTDTLRFGASILSSDVEITRINSGNDYLLTIANGGGTVQIVGGAGNDMASWLETIEFADGTVWTREMLDQSVVPYTEGDDNIDGTTASETLHGGGGNDTIRGKGGDDRLYGDAGNDTVLGYNGRDILSGGTGNDLLVGGGNNDIYLFNLGDGQDTIQEDSHGWSVGYGGTDTLQFGAGIDPADVIVTQANNGNDYVLSISGTTDQVTLSEAMNNNNAAIENVVFANGTTWSSNDLHAMS